MARLAPEYCPPPRGKKHLDFSALEFVKKQSERKARGECLARRQQVDVTVLTNFISISLPADHLVWPRGGERKRSSAESSMVARIHSLLTNARRVNPTRSMLVRPPSDNPHQPRVGGTTKQLERNETCHAEVHMMFIAKH